MELEEHFQQAARVLREAQALLICAGAGMGVDSGLPDFRGDSGFWRAYPLYRRLGINFMEAANPEQFERDPAFGWGFYGHRSNLYRQTAPHRGFRLLLDWIDRFTLEFFVVTSNVDGQFQKAGFPEQRILEVHGSIHHLQCTTPCCDRVWENGESFVIDEESMRADHVPHCPRCNAVARPNILMFGDYAWIDGRTRQQQSRFRDFLDRQEGKRVAVLEIGAGTAIPTIRAIGERVGGFAGGRLIRINPREPQVSPPHISIACGALEALSAIGSLLSEP